MTAVPVIAWSISHHCPSIFGVCGTRHSPFFLVRASRLAEHGGGDKSCCQTRVLRTGKVCEEVADDLDDRRVSG
jgi:hypothetical protein